MLALLALLLSTAQAWEVIHSQAGKPLSWEQMPIRYTYDDRELPLELDPDAARDAIEASFDVWADIDGADIRFEQVPLDHPDADDRDVQRVHWVEDWQWAEGLLALTSTRARPGGEIVSFEIRLNASYDNWGTDGDPDKMDLQNAMAHEVGHALALDHSSEEEATMWSSARTGEIHKRTLHENDQDGARHLYGEALTADSASVGLGGIASGGMLAALGLPLLLLARRRP